MTTKICSKCEIEKPFNCFHKSKKEKSGFKSACKLCLNTQNAKYAAKRRITDRDLLNKRTFEWRKRKLKENPNYCKQEYYRRHESNKANARKYYHSNIEKCLMRQKNWIVNNKEKSLNASRNWKIKNIEQSRTKHRAWMKNNADAVRNYNRKRRALKVKATIHQFSQHELMARMSVFGFVCAYCGGPFEQIDHVKALSKGGYHCLANLRPSCSKCNSSKHNKPLLVWLMEKARMNSV